jgi:hypothetical protein
MFGHETGTWYSEDGGDTFLRNTGDPEDHSRHLHGLENHRSPYTVPLWTCLM